MRTARLVVTVFGTVSDEGVFLFGWVCVGKVADLCEFGVRYVVCRFVSDGSGFDVVYLLYLGGSVTCRWT